MPELPEVTTTIRGLNKTVKNKTITGVWSDWKKTVKYPTFDSFRKRVVGKKILSSERCGKNILIHLSEKKTLLVHLKMTGHLMYGLYKKKGPTFRAEGSGPLRDDPYNKYVHLLFTFSNKKSLALSDARKFAKVKLFNSDEVKACDDLKNLGPDALSVHPKEFLAQLNKKLRGKIKTVLMDQSVIAGIGNIYSDEILWFVGVHPESRVGAIPKKILQEISRVSKKILAHSITIGGDSKSDYRNIHGQRGGFQNFHRAYRQTGNPCAKKNCRGTIKRLMVGARSAHFCDRHQKKYA